MFQCFKNSLCLQPFDWVELSDNCIDQLVFPLTMDMLGQNYVLVRCVSHHFTVAIKDGTPWVYAQLMICVIQSQITLHARTFFIAIPKVGFL